MRQTKCIIVHLSGKRKTLAFGSIAAIFHHLTRNKWVAGMIICDAQG